MSPLPTLRRYRKVELSKSLQRTFALPEFICADPEGMPFLEGQGFYAWLIDQMACQPVTATSYLKSVLQFLSFLWSRSLSYAVPVWQVRQNIEAYLRDRLGCVIRPHREGNRLIIRSGTVTRSSIRLYLVSLKRFYDYLLDEGKYTGINPLSWEKWLALQGQRWTPKMPPQSGMTLPDKSAGRHPATYFCIANGEWKPEIIDDPNLPQRVLKGMIHQRDQIIVRMLFESGARISEILNLTVGDWQHLRGRRHGALATNKGSWGERVKEIWWSSETSQLLQTYLKEERRLHDPCGRGLNELPETAPLFITETGGTYCYPAFYDQWRKACARQGIVLHPHQARHWFVTMALCRIKDLPDETKREADRQALIAYMHWKSPETVKAYDHHLQLTDFQAIHLTIEQLVHGEQTYPVKEMCSDANGREVTTDVSPDDWKRVTGFFDERGDL